MGRASSRGLGALVLAVCCLASLGSCNAKDVDASIIGVLYGFTVRGQAPIPATQVEVFLFLLRPCAATSPADHRYSTTAPDDGSFRVVVEQFGGGPTQACPIVRGIATDGLDTTVVSDVALLLRPDVPGGPLDSVRVDLRFE